MNAAVSIAVVERETGIGKDTLRVWERRYGFPQPLRDTGGDRLYPAEQVERLRLIRRLMDRGFRPGRLVGAEVEALLSMANQATAGEGAELSAVDTAVATPSVSAVEVGEMISSLTSHDAEGVRRWMSRCITRDGLRHFVLDRVPEMNQQVGEAWDQGRLQVFEEHLYTELLQMQLRQAILALPPGRLGPVILLTTVPEEQHALGVLMLEALFTMQGARCVSLGTQTPLGDIEKAARAHGVDVVALSFSAAFPPRQIAPLVERMRAALSDEMDLWCGGSGMAKMASARQRPKGVEVGVTLDAALALLDHWRATRATH